MTFRLWLESQWEAFPYRQRQFPWMSMAPERGPYVRNAKVTDDEEFEQKGLYHVTTALSAIKRDHRLKSRRELGYQVGGLGGGMRNEAPDKISMTNNYSRAHEIYEEMQFVAQIIQGRVSASHIYQRMKNHEDPHGWEENRLNKIEVVANEFGVPKKWLLAGDEQKVAEFLDRKIRTPKERYDFFQRLERAAIEENMPSDTVDYQWTTPTIGFTTEFEKMNLRPEEIAIIQCVIRKNARTETVPEELELRVHPEDVAIVRFMQPPFSSVI